MDSGEMPGVEEDIAENKLIRGGVQDDSGEMPGVEEDIAENTLIRGGVQDDSGEMPGVEEDIGGKCPEEVRIRELEDCVGYYRPPFMPLVSQFIDVVYQQHISNTLATH
jgi:hypothetical protein